MMFKVDNKVGDNIWNIVGSNLKKIANDKAKEAAKQREEIKNSPNILEKLASTADKFEAAGHHKLAENMTQILERLVKQMEAERPTSEQMIENLKNHGHVLNMKNVSDISISEDGNNSELSEDELRTLENLL